MGTHLSQEEESSKRACGILLLIRSDVAGILEHWCGQVGGDGFELMILAASFSAWNLGSLNLLSPEEVRS